MKKLLSFIILAIASINLFAQQPNRLVITDVIGQQKAFRTEDVDSITFETVEGVVAANITFEGFYTGETGDTLKVSIVRTEACKSFRIGCVPSNVASQLTSDAIAANYLESTNSPMYDTDFSSAFMMGFDFSFAPKATYDIITVGYDIYGCACSMSAAEFDVPSIPLVGAPSVSYTIDEVTSSSFTISFSPNADVAGYACCSFDKGSAEEQFNMFGAWMGFNTIGDMIKAWGYNETTEQTKTWENMGAGKDYEVYVQCWDVNGTFADMIIVPVKTSSLGGDGVAEINIEVKEFGGDATNGYWQRVVYTPNDQTCVYHDMIITEEGYNEMTEEGIKAYLQEEHPNTAYWDIYGVDDAKWNASPSTTYYAFAMGKNANGEWGTLASKQFTTPSLAQAAPIIKQSTMPTKLKSMSIIKGKSPFMNSIVTAKKLQLIQK